MNYTNLEHCGMESTTMSKASLEFIIIIIIIITHKPLEPGHNSPQLLTAHLWGPHVNVQCSAFVMLLILW